VNHSGVSSGDSELDKGVLRMDNQSLAEYVWWELPSGLPNVSDEYRKKWLLHIQKIPQNIIHIKSYNYKP
jgi:hypothetical protein